MERPTVIITGAGRGIGRATAMELSRRGYELVLVARTGHELRETSRLCGREALIVEADVAEPDSAPKIVTKAVERFMRIDAVVNAAGVAPVLDVESTTDKVWKDVIDANLSSAFYMARAVWPIFRARRGGVIVNLSSYAARDPFPRFVAYAAAKGGLNLLGLSLAREGAPLGIRVHTVAPAAVETAMFRQILSREQFPPHRALAPAEVASVIAQCVIGDLKYTSGEVIWLSRSGS